MALTHEQRQMALETATTKQIIDVAQSLGMDLIKNGKHYIWSDHDSFVLTPKKNLFYWNSQQRGGGPIQLVQLMKECSYKDAVHYLNTIDSEAFVPTPIEEDKKPFYYYVKDTTTFTKARDYLINVRKISPEIVTRLYNEGYLRQAMYMPQYPDDKHLEPCIVAKWKWNDQLVGGTIQGLVYNPEIYGKRGRDKKIMGNVEPNFGFNYVLGQPTKIVFAESFIDLLSYWTLHPELDNCMLADLEGLKHNSVEKFITYLVNEQKGSIQEGVIVAVDNDVAGQCFVDKLSKFQFTEHENYELAQPHNNAILKEHMYIYQQVAKEYDIDPLAIATVHKAFTNGSSTNALANYWNNDQFFGKKLKPKEQATPINVLEESTRVAKELLDVKISRNEYDFRKLVTKGTETIQTIGMREKLARIYKMYQFEGIDIRETIIKDQNDLLKETLKKNVPNIKKTGERMEQKNDFFLELNYTLEDTIQKMEKQPEGTTNYLTKETLHQLLSEHLNKIDQLITHFQSSYDLLAQPTKDEAEQIKDGLVQTVELTNSEIKKTLSENLAEPKEIALFSVKEKANQIRISIKNTFNKPILQLNAKIRKFIDKIDRKFALEGKEATAVLTEKEANKKIIEEDPQELVTTVQKYIQISDKKELIQKEIQKEIQKNPLAPIDDLQKELEAIFYQLTQTEHRIDELTPSRTVENLDELTSLVKERDRLQEERKQLVNHPDFLRSKDIIAGQLSPLEAFRKVDQQVIELEKEITRIENGLPEKETVKKETERVVYNESRPLKENRPPIDPFSLATAAVVKEVSKTVDEKNKSFQSAIKSKNNQEVTKHLKENMQQYFSSTNIKNYLNSANKFHQYSSKNIQLIMEQAPNATQVANKNKWEQMGYTLKSDPQPIQIYQPVFTDKLDAEGNILLDDQNKPIKEVDFHLTEVYDVSQTTNETLKHTFTYNVSEKNSFLSVYKSMEELTNITIDFQSLEAMNSHYDISSNTLTINTGLGKEETIQAILKETIPHYMTNHSSSNDKPNPFELEAVGYMIASHVGLDTTQFTFDSLEQLKANGYSIENFTQSLNKCSKHATTLISNIDKNYEQMLTVDNKKNKFEERLSHAKIHNTEVTEQLKSKDETLAQKTTVRL